ncbi:MAG: lysine--tRNA ligase [bacterium]|nr:lysine--tRNA ligase [bacterium]
MALPIEELRKTRLEKLEKIRSLGVNPYPSRWEKEREEIAGIRQRKTGIARASGRIMAIRGHGGSTFIDLIDESGKLQLFFGRDFLDGQMKKWQEEHKTSPYEFLSLLDIGDFRAAEGELFETKAGELTLKTSDYCLLTKSIRPLPSQWYGLKDVEERYRKRYLDLLLNPEVRELFQLKSKFWANIRNYMLGMGFLEVEMPVLEGIPGGADARPFITHHNALNIDLYLRISLELPLKRLLVGGYEKVFEIGRIFRNEGMDDEHLQDYTQLEFYWAYADYNQLMDFVQNMYQTIIQETFGTLKLKWKDQEIVWSGNWPRIEYTNLLNEKWNIDIDKMSTTDLYKLAKKLKVKVEPNLGKGRLLDYLYKKTIRPFITQPMFVLNHPVEVEPLAKRLPGDSSKVQRMQVLAMGSELGKGFSELNDPLDQRQRFEDQMKLREAGDEEAQMMDEDYVEAMEYGMPPNTGFGVSERLFSMLVDRPIKECVVFPTMKREGRVMSQENKNKGQDFSKKFVVILNKDEEIWRAMNALGHITAFLGNKMTDVFDTGDYFVTKDEIKHPRNSQYPVITLSATGEKLINLMEKVRESGLLYIGYVPEMIDTTNDEKLEKMIANKEDKNIVYIGIGIFGDTNNVDALTKGLTLYKK